MKRCIPIKIKKGKNCFYANLESVLFSYNYPLTEAQLFFLSNSANCFFDLGLSMKKYMDIEEVFTMSTCDDAANVLANILSLEKHSVTYDKCNEYDQKKFQQDLKICISKSNPIIVMMNQRALAYHPSYYIELQNPRHGIILYGYDENKRLCYIGDSFVLNSQGIITSYTGTMSLSAICDNMLGYMWFKQNEEKRIDCVDTRRILRTVIMSLKEILFVRPCASILQGNQALIHGFGYLIERMQMDTYNNEELYKFIHLLKMRYMILFDYLADIIVDLKPENSLCDSLLSLIRQWDAVITRLLMTSFSCTAVEKIMDRIIALIKEQEDILSKIIDYLEKK